MPSSLWTLRENAGRFISKDFTRWRRNWKHVISGAYLRIHMALSSEGGGVAHWYTSAGPLSSCSTFITSPYGQTSHSPRFALATHFSKLVANNIWLMQNVYLWRWNSTVWYFRIHTNGCGLQKLMSVVWQLARRHEFSGPRWALKVKAWIRPHEIWPSVSSHIFLRAQQRLLHGTNSWSWTVPTAFVWGSVRGGGVGVAGEKTNGRRYFAIFRP